MTEGASGPKYPIESVGNALTALHMLRSNGPMKVTELAEALGIARSTAHRMVAILQSHGFASVDEGQRYSTGPALLRLGASAISGLGVRRVARPVLSSLARATGETCELAILDGTDVLLIDVAEGTQSLRVVDELGGRAPAHLTAAGKAILAALPRARLNLLYDGREYETVTPYSINSRLSLDEELDRVRSDGFASVRMELGVEYVGVAAAIRLPIGNDPAAITIALPALRADEDFASSLGPVVSAAASAITTYVAEESEHRI